MTLRDSRGMNYDSKLQNMSWFCYKHVNTLSQTKHYHMVVLQQNTTEFRWGTIIEDIEVFTQVHGLDPKHRLLFLEQVNRWLSVLGTHIE